MSLAPTADPANACSSNSPVAVVAPVAATVQIPAVSDDTIFVIWNNDYLTVTVMMFDVNTLVMYNNATILQVSFVISRFFRQLGAGNGDGYPLWEYI